MKRAACLALLALAGRSMADPAAPIDGPAPTTADDMRLMLHDQVQLQHPGATAAFSVDPRVVEVSAHDGKIDVVTRNPGETTVSVVTPEGVTSFAVTVVAPPPWYVPAAGPDAAAKWTLWSGQYDSLTARLFDTLEVVDEGGGEKLRAYAVDVTRLDSAADDHGARTSLPALALEWHAHGDRVVIFDEAVEHSPLTLDGTALRGVHVRYGGLELHAGVTSPVLYQNIVLSPQAETVVGASYELRSGRSSVTPSIYAYPTAPQTGGTSGVASTLLYRYADEDLHARAELGWGGVAGAAGELTYQHRATHVRFEGRHEPRGFAALGIGRPLGSMLDTTASTQLGAFGFSGAATAARYDIGVHDEDLATFTGETRMRLAPHATGSIGVSLGQFGGDLVPAPVRSLSLPVGFAYEAHGAGAALLYRYQENSARNHGGHGARLSAHASSGRFHASAYVDVQEEAASVSLILHDEPQLAQLLEQLGLTATSTDDLARLLRENAMLAQLGYVQGTTLDFNPWRAQAGIDIALIAQDETHQQLRVRALIDHTQTDTSLQDTRTVSLSYARRVAHGVDASAMVSWWSGDALTAGTAGSWSFGLGARARIDDVPHFAARPREITGTVVADGGEPLAGVTVRLDGGRTAVTGAGGRFSFAAVPAGDHWVEADGPEDTYFTSASRVSVAAGGTVQFAVVHAQARLTGTIHDDAGTGLAGVSVALRSSAGARATLTDSAGRFRFAVAPGDYELAVARETVPVGHDASSLGAQAFALRAGEPQTAELVIAANRSIAGRLAVAPGGAASVRIVELDRTAALDSAGRYVFRGLPAGSFTVEATIAGVTKARTIELAAGPAAVKHIDF